VLARALDTFNYPQMPPQSRSPGCRADGPLDEHPGGGWPDY
jgi:hypothetical protein